MPTKEDLEYFQKLPLDLKVMMSKARTREWISYYGEDGVYIAFSGGKDSTVLRNLIAEEDKLIQSLKSENLELKSILNLKNIIRTKNPVFYVRKHFSGEFYLFPKMVDVLCVYDVEKLDDGQPFFTLEDAERYIKELKGEKNDKSAKKDN